MKILNDNMVLFRYDNSPYGPEFYIMYTDSDHLKEVKTIIGHSDGKGRVQNLINVLIEKNIPYHLIRVDEITSVSRYLSTNLSKSANVG